MRNLNDLMLSVCGAMEDRHEDPKNKKKGDYPDSRLECFKLLYKEIHELEKEVYHTKQNRKRIFEEVGDCANYLGMILQASKE